MSIHTPCVKVCAIDPVSRLCVGCGRALDEIAQWSGLSDGERARIMTKLVRRMARAGSVIAAEQA